ncbi:hypothetical protein KQX54_017552 [Cotesia glomerata]|uniref:Uncharacterized protein n=1 Tax=Cotesia glomerata TaxID=32391 RepID=A0AAV7IEH2_COTGL|nr:hypothetical protein KQX54_017552 [Cotesia glomerata]
MENYDVNLEFSVTGSLLGQFAKISGAQETLPPTRGYCEKIVEKISSYIKYPAIKLYIYRYMEVLPRNADEQFRLTRTSEPTATCRGYLSRFTLRRRLCLPSPWMATKKIRALGKEKRCIRLPWKSSTEKMPTV